ncbi:MAG: hypothetical protein SPJ83_01800 [Helicobacter sp.]|uniref:Uncharacterized protein n=1 Tax=Helicobacter bilis WiWa TaxID=1235804 RepID=N2BL83_9HELI|nr:MULTISPECIES: hypothetical protein [Helicobacter]EMZ39243.1 hypothetical protein C826_01219 [Helicobacter bilis WiWa]MCI7411006.1 hypothetical protein [Helicobacter bilis]MDD7296452.1 hypothetical protein [Helicobacter bilis]MDY4399952.1 hypothetical protein [Helicobacter bilis]MDY5821521.1 hypothetical protein [Helicobacter sp.]
MQFLQLGLIFVVLICLTIIIFKILGFVLPLILWLMGIVCVGAIIALFGVLFYNLMKK